MATLPNSEELWTVREYLHTSWSPDREFADGRIEERNLGEKKHSIIQRFLTVLFAINAPNGESRSFQSFAPKRSKEDSASRMYW